jgi:hypothetical protein
MKYTKEQLIDVLVRKWEYLCHDDPDPEDDTPEEYRLKLECYSLEDLLEKVALLTNLWRTIHDTRI